MPIIGSFATACARAFGFLTGLRESIVYTYAGFFGSLSGPNTPFPNKIYGSDSNTLTTTTDIGWTFAVNSGGASGECGIIVDGLIIATGRAISTDGGITWTNIQLSGGNGFGGYSYTGTNSAYAEGLIAYNPTSKLMGRISSGNNPDYPYVNYCYFTLWDLQTKTLVNSVFLGSIGPDSIVYSAPQNYFIIRGYNYSSTIYYMNGTTGTSVGTGGSQFTVPAGAHPTLGYLFYVYAPPAYVFGVYQGARISATADPAASYTDLGPNNLYSGTMGKPVWCPVNNKWFRSVSSGGALQIWSSPTGAQWTYLAQPLYWGYVASTPVIKETSAGVLYLSGLGYTDPGGSPSYSGWSKSSNGGVTWDTPVYGQFSSVTNNLNP